MGQRIWSDPEGGFPGTWEEDDGSRAPGTYSYMAYVYGPDEVPHADAKSIAEWRAKYWDQAQGALVIPFTGGRTFTFGPKLLSQTTDETMVCMWITFKYAQRKGPPPEECFCGKLSYRHAVVFHKTADRDQGELSVSRGPLEDGPRCELR